MKKYIYSVVLSSIVFLLPSGAGADTIHLKTGKSVAGTITAEEQRTITITVDGKPVTFYRGEIKSIERDNPPPQSQDKIWSRLSELTRAGIADEKRELIKRLLDANGTRESLTKIFSKIIEDAEPESQAGLRDLLQSEKLIEQILPVYEKHFSVEEIKELLAFYLSPTGHKNLQLTPQITNDVLEATVQYFKSHEHLFPRVAPGANPPRKPSNFWGH